MGILQREKSVLSSHVCERAAGSQLGESQRGALNKLFAIRPGLHCLQLCKCSTFALLATMSYAKPQFETFSKEKKNPRDRLFVLLL